jgi:hypothetical protein
MYIRTYEGLGLVPMQLYGFHNGIEKYELKEWTLYKGKIAVAHAGSVKKGTYVAVMESPSIFLPEIIRMAKVNALADKKNVIADQLNSDTWFQQLTRITFLGRPLKKNQYLHIEMAKRLKTIEATFMKQLGSSDTKTAGDMLLNNSKEPIAGSRPTSRTATFSMHMFGLAIDVNYLGNPYIQSKDDIAALNCALSNAALLTNTPIPSYTEGYKKEQFDTIEKLNKLLKSYFSLLDDLTALQQYLKSSQSPLWHKLSPLEAKDKIQKHLDKLAGLLVRGGKRKEYFKKHGILNFDKRFVVGMEKMGLYWGAHYGDIMHFDLRQGIGKYINAARNEYRKAVNRKAKSLFAAGKYGQHDYA